MQNDQSDEIAARAGMSPLIVAVTASLLTLIAVAVALFALLASNGASSNWALSLTQGTPGPVRLDTTNKEAVGVVVDSVFGTIQFAIAVLSGLVLVISVGVTYVMGRNARETQNAAREELRQVASLYRENIESLSKSIEATTQEVIREYVKEGDPKRTVDEYARLHGEISQQYEEVKDFLAEIGRAAKDFEALGTDYDGAFQQVVAEEYAFNEEKSDQSADFWSAPDKRARLQQALIRLEDGALLRSVSANDTFNAAQTAARAGLRERSHRLATLAAWLEDTPLYRLRMFRADFERCDRYAVEKGVNGKFGLVSQNPDNDPAIAARLRGEAYETIVGAIPTFPSTGADMLYSEVWNIFVHASKFDEFIRVMKLAEADAAKTGRYIPSCFHAVLARAWSVLGEPGWREQCIAELRTAMLKLNEESPGATWVRDARRDIERAMRGGEITINEVLGLPPAPADEEDDVLPGADGDEDDGAGEAMDNGPPDAAPTP